MRNDPDPRAAPWYRSHGDRRRCYICNHTVRRDETETIRRGDVWLTICRAHFDEPYAMLDACEASVVPIEHP